MRWSFAPSRADGVLPILNELLVGPPDTPYTSLGAFKTDKMAGRFIVADYYRFTTNKDTLSYAVVLRPTVTPITCNPWMTFNLLQQAAYA